MAAAGSGPGTLPSCAAGSGQGALLACARTPCALMSRHACSPRPVVWTRAGKSSQALWNISMKNRLTPKTAGPRLGGKNLRTLVA
eukprot:9898860-Lingulodinium_polyedra.AAC.1